MEEHAPPVAIYRQEESEGVMAATILEILGGPKDYARIWDATPWRVEWGWRLHPTAVEIWRAP